MAVLALAVVLAPLAYLRGARDPFTPPKEAAFAVVLTALAAVLGLGGARRGVVTSRAVGLAVAICVAGAVSGAFAASPSQAIESVRDLAIMAVPAVIVGCALLRTPRRVLLLANALGASAFVVAVIGILQHQRLDWWGYRATLAAARGSGAPPSPDLLALPFVEPLVAAAYSSLDRLSRPDADLSWAGPLERPLREFFASRPFARLPTNDGPASVFGHPNVAAEVVSAGFVALAVAARAGWRRALDRGRAAFAIVPLALRLAALATMGLYILVTGTRGAWVAIAASSALLASSYVFQGPSGRRGFRFAIVAVAALAAAGVGFAIGSTTSVAGRGGGETQTPIDRLAALFRPAPDPAKDTILERRILWANTRPMLDPSRPSSGVPSVFGVGPGNWQVAYPLHHRSVMVHPVGTYTPQRYADHPHQDPLEFLAEYGLLGLIPFALLLGTAAARLIARTRLRGEDRHAALALLAVIASLGTVSLFSFPLHLPVGLSVFFLAIGASLSVAAPAVAAPPAWSGPLPGASLRIAITGIALAAIAALGGAREGAAIAASVAVIGSLATRWVFPAGGVPGIAATVLFAAGLAAFPDIRGAIGGFDAAVALAGVAAAGLATLPLDARASFGLPSSRAIAVLGMVVFAFAALGAGSRIEASREFRWGIDYAWGARSIPGERRSAELRSRDAFDRATVLNPSDFLAETSRAGFLDWSGFRAEAEASAARALVLHPCLINARIELADLALKKGDDDRAVREARAARALNPDAVEPHLQLGVLFLRQGRPGLAVDEFERAVDLSPGRFNPDARIRAAEIHLMEEAGVAKALSHLAAAERDAPDDPVVLGRVARLYSAPGAPPQFQAKAEALWKRVIALNPFDSHARMRVTISPLLRGEPSRQELEAIVETLDALIRSNPDFDPPNVRYFRALALERLGRTDEALRGYREVALLAGVAPFRGRREDAELDAAIEALRALWAQRESSESRPAGSDSSPTRPPGR